MKKIEKTEKRISYSSLTQNLWLVCISMLFLSGYTSQLWAQCNGEIVINQTGPGVFTWEAPATGGPFQVEIIVTGGGGGDNFANVGGGGASMGGFFTVQNGQTLFAVAGGVGGSSDGTEGGGGGAGSGVVNCGNPSDCLNGTILIIAAGGNGAENTDGLGGLETTGSGGPGAGGGNGGGGGGGGLNGNGGSGSSMGMGIGGGGGGQVFRNGLSAGGNGSNPNNNGANGMGGGGGGGNNTGNGSGGGGGHTGASGGNSISAQSFNTGANQTNAPGDPGGGSVTPGSVLVICVQSLPVKLINFKAVIEDSNVSLLWSTATEKNNLGFEVERSTDNRHWTTLGFVPGNGTTAMRNDYNFTDEKPLAGVNYYRLRQNDSDGQFEYSPIVIADVRGSGLQFDVFPNPSTTGELSIRAVSEQEGNGVLEIFDWVGYKVFMETVQLHKGTTIYPVSMTTFPKGTYTARLEMPDGQVQFKKIVLQ